MSEKLSSILKSRSKIQDADIGSAGLEKGRLWVWSPGTQSSQYAGCCFCWVPPSNGKAIVEVWGASGSGAMACCHSSSVPGNPGAYVRKAICVTTSDYIQGYVGQSCNNPDCCRYRGVSEASCVVICSQTEGCICLCAQGGQGGMSVCLSDGTASCCWTGIGYCLTPLIEGAASCCCPAQAGRCCFIVCNYGAGFSPARAFGGDTNKDGGISCTTQLACSGGCIPCCVFQHVRTSPGIFAEEGTFLTFNLFCSDVSVCRPGQTLHHTLQAMNIAGKRPVTGGAYLHAGGYPGPCARICGCWQFHGCQPWLPPGIPGSTDGGNDLIDRGLRGGQGLVKIRFIGS